jgi:hypothetical protein
MKPSNTRLALKFKQMHSICEKAIANCPESAHGVLVSKNVNFVMRKDAGLWI